MSPDDDETATHYDERDTTTVLPVAKYSNLSGNRPTNIGVIIAPDIDGGVETLLRWSEPRNIGESVGNIATDTLFVAQRDFISFRPLRVWMPVTPAGRTQTGRGSTWAGMGARVSIRPLRRASRRS